MKASKTSNVRASVSLSCLLLLSLTVLNGCASTIGSGTPPPISTSALPVMDVEHLEVRALLLLLVDRQIYDGFAVRRALAGGPKLRKELALTLGRIDRPEGISVLIELLGDPEPTVRQAAAFALGELGELGFSGIDSALLDSLTDSDLLTGVLAVEALAKMRKPLELVVARLIDVPSEEFFSRLLPSLFRFSFVEENGLSVIRWAEQGLEQEDEELRALAVYALARQARPEGAPLLRAHAGNSDPWVRGLVARGLGQVGQRADLDLLLAMLDDEAAGPVIQALRAARGLIDQGVSAAPESWRPRLLELMSDPRPGVRITAIEVSAIWLLDAEIGVRLAELAVEGSQREQALALLALAEGEDPRAAPLLLRFAESADPVLRARAAEAAGLYRALQIVERLTEDSNPGVRIAALQTLLAGEVEDAAPRARAALQDVDPAVRSTALNWFAEHPILPLDELEESLARSARDTMLDARLSVVQALAARALAEPLERGTIVALVEELAADTEFLVRRRAIASLRDLDRDPPELGGVASVRTSQTYREIVQRTARRRSVDILTEKGTIRVQLACPMAPLTCLNFLQLAGQGYYDGIVFHRVVTDFVIQAGDPRGDGWGGPGYSLRDEINLLRYDRGTVGMALSGPDTGGSQFFITLSPQPHLDGGYTVFGEVVDNREVIGSLDVIDRIVQGDRILQMIEVSEN